jgi:hypothetical protein
MVIAEVMRCPTSAITIGFYLRVIFKIRNEQKCYNKIKRE